MKILLVTMDYPPPVGGIQTFCHSLEQGLIARGHEVRVLNVDSRNQNNFRRLRPPDFLPTPVHPVQTWVKALNPLRLNRPNGYREVVYYNLVWRLSCQVQADFRPDVIHLLKPTLSSAVHTTSVPFVVSCYSEELDASIRVRIGLDKAHAIHAISRYTQSLIPNHPSRLIYIGLPLTAYTNHPHREPFLLTVSRLVKRKNIKTLLQAFASLPEALRTRYRYVIVGDGPERTNLEALAAQLGLSQVQFVGEVDEATKRDYLARAWAFALCPIAYTSDYETNAEGFGLVYLEAQVSGAPILASALGGIPEAVGDAGLLVQNPANVTDISHALERLLMDEDLRQRLRRAASQRMAQFDFADTVTQLEALYREVL